LQYETKWFHIASMEEERTATPNDDCLDAILHALSDRTRRQLLRRLADGPAMVGELAKPIDMTRVAVAKHLRVLEQARLITRTADGRARMCALTPGPLRAVERWLTDYREFWNDKLEALARYAEEPDDDQR
jgi:DNA-binding transcriptional ArsR family regulator